jgi:hypothetical protein
MHFILLWEAVGQIKGEWIFLFLEAMQNTKKRTENENKLVNQ